jgi:hypothetical protein
MNRVWKKSFWLVVVVLLAMMAVASTSWGRTQREAARAAGEAVPEPGIAAVLAAFDKYEVVGLPQGHGEQDVDNFIYALVRTPGFSDKVNDIALEGLNAMYQPALDRYIAGEDVRFVEVQKAWRKSGQPAAGASVFIETMVPLVRALNQKLPAAKRVRVLAGEPAVDWDQIKGPEDVVRLVHRDANIAALMEKEVLAKHRKALMLFGTFHLMHSTGGSAVSIYEKDYPGVTMVVTDLGYLDTDLALLSDSKFAKWPIPALARAKGTWLGALDLSHFLPPPSMVREDDCSVHHDFPKPVQKPMEELVDAFLYLGPQDLRLAEKIPADIALDAGYKTEFQRGGMMLGFPHAARETEAEFEQEIVTTAENPMFAVPKQVIDAKADELARKSCEERKEKNGRKRD